MVKVACLVREIWNIFTLWQLCGNFVFLLLQVEKKENGCHGAESKPGRKRCLNEEEVGGKFEC